MSDLTGPDEAVAVELEEGARALLSTDWPDRVCGYLVAEFDADESTAEDAICFGFAEAVRRVRSRPIENLGAYVFKVAKRHLLRLTSRTREFASDEVRDENEEARSAEEEVLEREVYELLIRIVRGWENANLRSITLLFLESYWAGDPLSHLECAEMASASLGYAVNVTSVAQWRKRGMERLLGAAVGQGIFASDLAPED